MKVTLSVIKNFIKGANEKNLSIYAAGSAFFWILSIVPIIVVISSLITFTGLTEEILLDAVLQFFPKKAEQFLISLVSYVYANSTGMLPIAIVIAVWSAGRGMLALMRGLNEIYGIVEKRSYFKLRLIASCYMIMLLLGLVFTLVISVFGRSVFDNFLVHIPILSEMIGLLLRFRYLLAVLILSAIFTLMYTYVPDIKTTLKKQFYGGLMASLGCAAFSYCFSVYVDNYNDFSGYGSISIIVIIMLWLYITMYILLYGAYIGSYFEKDTKDAV